MTVDALQTLASQGDAEDNVKAVLALQKRARQGNAEAFNALLTLGFQDNAEAVLAHREFAGEGNEEAFIALLTLATQGSSEAFRALEALASQGNADAADAFRRLSSQRNAAAFNALKTLASQDNENVVHWQVIASQDTSKSCLGKILIMFWICAQVYRMLVLSRLWPLLPVRFAPLAGVKNITYTFTCITHETCIYV